VYFVPDCFMDHLRDKVVGVFCAFFRAPLHVLNHYLTRYYLSLTARKRNLTNRFYQNYTLIIKKIRTT
jgi:hypothetical protein